jgi:hypothetical protein
MESPHSPFKAVRGRIRGRIAAHSSLDREALTFFGWNELDDFVIRDHANSEPIDLRNPRAESLRLRRLRGFEQRAN